MALSKITAGIIVSIIGLIWVASYLLGFSPGIAFVIGIVMFPLGIILSYFGSKEVVQKEPDTIVTIKSNEKMETKPATTEIIREKEVIVKVRCPYCKNVYAETLDKCPHCGGHQ